MSAFYRNKGYEETPVYSGHSGSQNYTRGYSSTRDYPDFPDPLNKPDYPSASSSPSSAGSRKSPDYLLSLPEPDYSDSQSSPYHRDSSKDLDYRGSQRNPEFAGSRSNRNYEGSRTSPDYLVSLGEPDYPGAQGTFDSPIPRANSNLLGSRRNLQYAGSGVNRSTRSLGQPDYPGAENQPSSSHFLGKPGYLVAENFQNSPDFWGNPDYPGAEDGRDYGSSDTLEVTRRSSGPLGVLGGDHEDYPENIEMTSMRMANPYDPSLPGAPGNGYVNPAFGGEGSPIPAYGNPPLTESHWYKSPQASDVDVLDPPLSSSGSDRKCNRLLRFSASLHGSMSQTVHSPECTGMDGPCASRETVQGQKLIASLIPMTSRDRIKTIRNQPRTMEEKRNLRKIVDKEKSKQSHRVLEFNCCAQCLSSISLETNAWALAPVGTIFIYAATRTTQRICVVFSVNTDPAAMTLTSESGSSECVEPPKGYRRAKSNLSELLNSVSLWQKTLKVIGGKFGTSVLSYFNFLRWLLKFNIFSFILNFSFITIPQFTVAEKNSLQFTGLELLTGAGYFRDTVLYYGYYTNSTIQHEHSGVAYNMQLAYIFTIGACLITCFFSLLFSMAKYFRNNFINPHIYSRGIAKLIFCWDFTVTHEKAVKLKQKNLSTEIRENLSEIRQENARLTFHQQLTRFSAHIVAWVVSTGVAVACCVAVYYLAEYNSEFLKKHRDPWAVLLLPFVVSCINLVVPRFYSMFRLVERYEMPRHEVYTLLIRNIFLKMSIIGILCYYWLNIVALSGEECWETLIGQEIYRLLLMDFLFSLADSFLGEFLRRIIGMRFITSLGLQEFDIARNVLELIYAQTLVWIGIFFCPLLPFIQMITLFIMFYVKNISLMMNFQPPSKAWRASQMMTFFIFLLFFPSFTGVLCTLAITIWRLKPSADCGPFRGLPFFIHSIYSWIDTLSRRPGYLWVVWIYQNLIGSVHFFFILTLIVLIITYLYWQITEGRKIMIRLLHEQIINEGKDKMFLIDKLIKLQDAEKRANPSSLVLERREVEQQGPLHFGEHEATPDLRYRRSVQEDSTKA